jgi:serine protease Do
MKPILLLSVLCMLASLTAHAEPLTPQQLYARLSPSIWLVHTFDSDGAPLATGSAVVTRPETLLTNCHVLRHAKRFSITNDNVAHEAHLQYLDVARDLCQITARNLQAPAVVLGDSDAVAVGQKVYALGNPRGLERTFSDGLVSALRRSDDHKLSRIQISAPISHGSSGGGLFDEQGRLVGITSSGFDDAQNLNFAIPINWAGELAARSDAAMKVAATASTAAPSAPVRAPEIPRTATPTAPGSPPRDGADVNDVAAVPGSERCREDYRKFLASRPPRAFAISDGGQCAWADGMGSPRPDLSKSADPVRRALDYCLTWYGNGCRLYAIDQRVVWARSATASVAPAVPGRAPDAQ